MRNDHGVVKRTRTLAIAVTVGVGATLAVFGAPSSAAPKPHVRDGRTVPVYSYENAVRESVWVRTTFDNDEDGVPDKVAVDIVRPRETAERKLKVPVILEASPYYSCCGRGNESERKEYDANGVITRQPLF